MRHTKELISHRQGYEQHVLSGEVVPRFSLSSASGKKEKTKLCRAISSD